MKKFNGYDEAVKNANRVAGERLPAGAYVCKVMGVRYEEGQNGNSDMIQLQFDISEGDHKGFFKSQYDNNTNEDKKWKGKATIYCPKDDGTEQDGWTANSFATWTTGFEASNNNYTWDWDETKWKGLTIGIVFGETGTNIDGKDIIYTEARRGCDAQLVRDGKAPKAKFKEKAGYGKGSVTPTASNEFMSIPDVVEEEIPF